MSDDEFVFGGDATDIPPGTYPGKLTGLSVGTSEAFGDFRKWDFTLDSGSVVGGASSMATGPKSKGGRWAIALLGRKPASGEKVQLIGLPCLCVVGLDKNDWPQVQEVLPPLAMGVLSSPGIPGPLVGVEVKEGETATISNDLPF